MSAVSNEISSNKFSGWKIFVRQFKNPLLLVFIIATVVSYILGQTIEATVIWVVMFLSVTLGFWNEYRAEKTVQDLLKRISFKVTVKRNGILKEIYVSEILVGDEINLFPGAVIPADIKLTESKEMEVNESVLTGESMPVFKKVGDSVYMGTVVTGGSAGGVVTAIGIDTKFGKISLMVSKVKPETEFEKGLRDFSTLLAKIAGISVFLIIIFGTILHHPIIETILFALTVAMGITPELLPLIVTLSLSYGAKKMAKKDVIVKEFVSIEDLGNMEILCTDKTGTLTEGRISVDSYTDINGNKSEDLLRKALICNSEFSQGHSHHDTIDRSIVDFSKSINFDLGKMPKKLFEIPFDYEKRYMAIGISDGNINTIICKGSPEEVVDKINCSEKDKEKILEKSQKMQKEGFRVIAVASISTDKEVSPEKVKNLKFDGFISFSDVPKKDLSESLKKFEALGVEIKIITGDNEIVAEKIANDAGFDFGKILVSEEIERMNDNELFDAAQNCGIFARVTPSQKTRIIEVLKKGGKTVGFMGDGINDSPALHIADVGISVNTATDVAKDAASIVLLRKNLSVIADGIKEGRITFQNTVKYILMGTSSDFGNMISAAAASIFLPFLPMTPVQVLLTDILYDFSQFTIPTDNVDSDQIKMPKNWNIAYIKKFMLLFGPISTVYDFLTFGLMYFMFHATGSLFQTGWFVESLITEILVVFVIRTRKIPFWKSKSSKALMATCLSVVLIAIVLPFSPLSKYLAFTPLPGLFFVFLIGITLTYLVLVEVGMSILNKYEISGSKS